MATNNRPITNNRFKEFFCGWAAGCVETCVLYPKSKLIFRQQIHNFHVADAFRQLRREGLYLLYRGVLPPLIQRTTTRSIMFGTYQTYLRLLQCPGPTTSSSSLTACHSGAAFMAGVTEACLCPLERTQVLLQTDAFHHRFRNTGEAFRTIYAGHGWHEFYRGFSLVVFRNGLSNVIFFTLREPIRTAVRRQLARVRRHSASLYNGSGGELSSPKSLKMLSKQPEEHNRMMETVVADFCSGAVLGACISTLFYPLNVVKNRIQYTLGGPTKSPALVFVLVWTERERKLSALYRGAHLNFSRSLLTWGITNTVYEVLMRGDLFGD